MADEKLALLFEIYKGTKLVDTREYREDSVTIGSGSEALLRLKHRSIAELSCVVNIEDGAATLLDLGANNVKVNDEPVSNVPLKSGDAFKVGDIRVVLKYADAGAEEDEEDDDAATKQASAEELAAIIKKAEADVEEAGESTDVEEEEPEATDPGPVEAPAPVAAAPSEPKADAPAPAEVAAQDKADDDEAGYNDDPEDVVEFIMRSGTAKTNLGIDARRPKVLEVNQMWENLLLDTRHFAKGGSSVSIGSSVGWRWNFLGIDMGWVMPPLNILLRYTPPMWSEVNSDWRNDFYAPDAVLASGYEHKLFDWEDGKYVAKLPEKWDGFMDVGEQRYTLDEAVDAGKAKKGNGQYQIPIDDDVRLMVDAEGMVFYSHMVRPGKKIITRINDDVDYVFMAFMTIIGFVGLMFGLIMWWMPPPAQNDVVEIPDRFVELILEKPPEEQKSKKPSGNPDAGEGAKAKREEGKTGKKDAKMKKAKGNKVKMKKQQIDKQIAESAGVLGALRDGAELDGVFGSSGLNSDITGGIGGLIGAKGTQIGAGGLGSRGSGLGGGGTAEGLGGLGTKGMGSGASGYGAGGGNFGAKGDGAIGTVGGDPIILGALDRSLIDEVIKRHMNQIRYCYQRELTKNNTLGGKIVIRFTIAKDGSVSAASTKSTTMNNSAVESCIEGRFMRMQFPTPKGGGIVIVSYPFLFAPG